jgi:hypothetical protein
MSETKVFSDSEFSSLDLGTGEPTSVPMEEVQVTVSPNGIMKNYCKAIVAKCWAEEFRRMEQIQLKPEELEKYFAFLYHQRVLSVENDCPLWRKLKVLWIPDYLQYCLDTVGEVILRDRGLTMKPIWGGDEVITYQEALEISNRLANFQDTIRMHQDAMPRGHEGDVNVMTTMLIAGHMRSINKVEHVAATYISAFLSLQLVKEQAFGILFRVQYDDLAFIQTALMSKPIL